MERIISILNHPSSIETRLILVIRLVAVGCTTSGKYSTSAANDAAAASTAAAAADDDGGAEKYSV